jgi:hypothetical protein
VHTLAAQHPPLPSPLPEEPPVPFAYLMRLSSTLAEQELDPRQQTHLLANSNPDSTRTATIPPLEVTSPGCCACCATDTMSPTALEPKSTPCWRRSTRSPHPRNLRRQGRPRNTSTRSRGSPRRWQRGWRPVPPPRNRGRRVPLAARRLLRHGPGRAPNNQAPSHPVPGRGCRQGQASRRRKVVRAPLGDPRSAG